jgi:uncharacterized Zn finger protein
MSRVTVGLGSHMPMSVRRPCPACGIAEGVARKVATVPGRPVVNVTLACESCGYEWQIEYDSPPMRPTIKPSDNELAS